MRAPGDDLRPPVAVPTTLGTVLVPAAAVAGPPPPPLPPGTNRAPVVWQKPLPAALRRYLPPETAAAVGSAQAPLPVGAPPQEGAEVQPAAFQTRQYAQLYRLIHQHSQLLIQVGCMLGVAGPDGRREVKQAAGPTCGTHSRRQRAWKSCRRRPQAATSLPLAMPALVCRTCDCQVYLLAASSEDPAHRQVAEQPQRMAQEMHAFAQQQSAGRRAQVRPVLLHPGPCSLYAAALAAEHAARWLCLALSSE